VRNDCDLCVSGALSDLVLLRSLLQIYTFHEKKYKNETSLTVRDLKTALSLHREYGNTLGLKAQAGNEVQIF